MEVVRKLKFPNNSIYIIQREARQFEKPLSGRGVKDARQFQRRNFCPGISKQSPPPKQRLGGGVGWGFQNIANSRYFNTSFNSQAF
jgi:hypothetical protein